MSKLARSATYEDLAALPENVVGEIIEGNLYVQPRPAAPHAFIGALLGMELGGPFDRGRGGPGGWIILDEPELHFGDDVVVPDLAGWHSDRLPLQDNRGAHFTTAPDWVAEIASPSTTQRDRVLKAPLYARQGVAFMWLVEPVDGRIEAYQRANAIWQWLGSWADDREARIPPFDAVSLDLSQLWARSRG
jgi:Uma2 family endonuclease